MALSIGTTRVRNGKYRYVFRDSYYRHELTADGRTVGVASFRYIGYIGSERKITRSKAKAICDRKWIDWSEIERLVSKGKLEIVEDQVKEE